VYSARVLRTGSALRERLANVPSWSLYVAIVLAIAAALVDATALTLHGVRASTTVTTVVVSSALAWIAGGALGFGALLVPPRLAEGPRARRAAVQLAVVAAAFVLMWQLTRPFDHRDAGPYIVIIALASATIGACLWLSQAQPPGLARAVLLMIALGAVSADLALGSHWYLSLHDTADTVAIAALCSAALPLRSRIARLKPGTLAGLVLAAAVAALTLVGFAGAWFPGWRTFDVRHAQNLRRHAAVLGALWDFDRDGYSSILWGGDCDDTDRLVHPSGGDQNCNGVDPPPTASGRDRGLAEEFGDPALPPGVVRDVLLITSDTWRADALDPRLMPRLLAHTERGLTLARAYPGGSATQQSIPLWFTDRADRPGLLDALRAARISSSAVVQAIEYYIQLRVAFDAKERVLSGDAVTQRTLSWLRASSPAQRRFHWAHYYDLHSPTLLPETSVPAAPHHLPPAYRQAAARVDAEISTLLDELARTDAFAHTLVVITSDHGEAFGEHQVTQHGSSSFEEVLRVPCIVLGAGGPTGSYPHPVSTRGMTATVLGAFGLRDASQAAEHLGRSLLRLRASRTERLHEGVFVYSARHTSGILAESPLGILIDDRYKFAWGLEDQFLELYDRQTDPGEHENLAGERPDLVQQRMRRLALIVDIDTNPRLPWLP
jgi:Sulfatase